MSVQVRGMGAWTPLGQSWPETWQQLLAGQSKSCRFDELDLDVSIDVLVCACDGLDRTLRGEHLLEGASARLAKTACREAVGPGKISESLHLYGGTTHGETDVLVAVVRDDSVCQGGHFRSLLLDTVPELLAKEFDLQTTEWNYSSCVSSSHALLSAWLDLRSGCREEALVVGTDALSAIGVAGFQRIGALSKTTCRPFQIGRDGTSIGEGAASVWLQAKASATGAVVLLSFGTSCEASHPTKPDREGKGLETAVRQALDFATLQANDVGAVYLHGTGTPDNDEAEAMAYQRVFGGSNPPATSLKSALGHPMGATGIINLLAAVETCRTGLIPPTLASGQSKTMGVNLVVDKPRQVRRGQPVLVEASAFGGNNVAMLIGVG